MGLERVGRTLAPGATGRAPDSSRRRDRRSHEVTIWPRRSCLGTSSQMSCLMFHEKQANVMSKSRKFFSRGVAARGKCHQMLRHNQHKVTCQLCRLSSAALPCEANMSLGACIQFIFFEALIFSSTSCVMALALVGSLDGSHHCTVLE